MLSFINRSKELCGTDYPPLAFLNVTVFLHAVSQSLLMCKEKKRRTISRICVIT